MRRVLTIISFLLIFQISFGQDISKQNAQQKKIEDEIAYIDKQLNKPLLVYDLRTELARLGRLCGSGIRPGNQVARLGRDGSLHVSSRKADHLSIFASGTR